MFKIKFPWGVQKNYCGSHGCEKIGIPKINLLIHQIIISIYIYLEVKNYYTFMYNNLLFFLPIILTN